MFDEAAERRAILEIGQAMRDAWNRGDATGFASLFTDDASFVAWTGAHGYGRQAIAEAHRPLLAGPLAGSRLTMTDESLRFIRADAAVLVTTGAVVSTERDHRSIQTLVLVKDDGRWQVSAFQNTRAES
ncbi:SgcJ/EcaC family oxidoreductase [Fodinicola acaciae]|uniref:SgcJ/EcaC family oxidoreductase n=1 Tax=Fodinicola acaciae TaxID=2681555 RepID=UPI0013D712C8|nr:SgcJ/EcaC family oxidoreductase [Fodinicola acaciae]